MKLSPWLLSLLLFPTLALADKPPVEASMVLVGTITVNPDGSVRGYTVQRKDEVPPGVLEIVQRTVSGWQFVPIVADGKAVTAEAGMTLRVVGKMTDAEHLTVRVADASFGCNSYLTKSLLPNACPPDTEVAAVKRAPPEYPREALRGGAEGEVRLLVDVGRDGRVLHAAAQWVNLYHLPRQDPDAMRSALAKAAEAAALTWEFKPPTVGPNAAKDHWVVAVPINYTFERDDAPTGIGTRNRRSYSDPGYGKWAAYLPGPVQRVPWAGTSDDGAGSVMAGSAPFVPDSRFVLKTPLARDAGQS